MAFNFDIILAYNFGIQFWHTILAYNFGYFLTFQKTLLRGNNHPIGEKIAQSGHPGFYIHRLSVVNALPSSLCPIHAASNKTKQKVGSASIHVSVTRLGACLLWTFFSKK
jgi:hypothetical protein